MDSPDHGAATAAAAAPAPPYGPALLGLPELDRPPALLTMPELEAVAAALPGKKRRLRETFERLAATSPSPLPFRWEDLDAYLSSFQYSVTLRLRQFKDLQPQVPLPASVPPCPDAATAGEGVVEKGKKRKASIQASEGADEEIRGVDTDEAAIKKACPLQQDVDANGIRLCPAPPGVGNGLAEAHGSTDTTMLLVPADKIAVVRLENPAATRCPSNAAIVQAGAVNPTSQQRRRRPPRPVPAPAPTIVVGDLVEKAKKLAAERKVEKAPLSVSHKAGEAKVTPPSPRANGVGNAVASTCTDMQVNRPVGKIKAAVEHELPAATCGRSGAATNIVMPALALDSTSVLVPLAPKHECRVEAVDVDMCVVVAEERTHEVTKVDTTATNSSPLQVKAQEEAYKVSPLPLISSGNGFAEVRADAGSAVLADAAGNTCLPQSSAVLMRLDPKLSPDNYAKAPKSFRVKGPNVANDVLQEQHMSEVCSERISQAEKQNKLFSGNHGCHPTGSNNLVLNNAQDGVERFAKEHGPRKGGPGQDRPADAKGSSPLPKNSRNNGNGKGKHKVNVSSETSKNASKFCYKCGSKDHVTHKCKTPKHLVELYLKNKKKIGANQICYRCGTKGHLARKCRTPKHLVDRYQNHRAEKKASLCASIAPQLTIN